MLGLLPPVLSPLGSLRALPVPQRITHLLMTRARTCSWARRRSQGAVGGWGAACCPASLCASWHGLLRPVRPLPAGTSFLNRTEATHVERIVTRLLTNGVNPAQIGVRRGGRRRAVPHTPGCSAPRVCAT